MFKDIVTQILNKALGTYIENVDASKLNVSIWGGDVKLNDLEIKQSALDQFNLPVRPVFGYIGSLSLKIPWKDMYNDRWVASVERVVLVVVPQTSIVYNEEKEDEERHNAKMDSLKRAEEARKLQEEKEKEGDAKPKDGFIEKLMAQVIRNIQIYIKSIHIRYEDCLSCPESPFAAGVTLHNLSILSTDSDWIPCLANTKLVYKLSKMDSLGLYWLPNTTLLTRDSFSKEDMLAYLMKQIASEEHTPEDMKYVLGPICSEVKLQLNTNPELPDSEGCIFSTPNASLDVTMKQLAIGVSHHQYSNMMALLDSMSRMSVSSKFRKYRPASKQIKGHIKEWWRYAYECKLENIRRVRTNWSWEHMKQHRAMCKKYKAVFKTKLESGKLSSTQQQELEECERILDIFNLTLIRRQAEMEVQREGKQRQEEKQKRGWFSGWFSSSTKEADAEKEEGNIVKKLEAGMSDDEKKKLYEAIGYSESGPPPALPHDYVDMRVVFKLDHLMFKITDDTSEDIDECVTQASLEVVAADFHTRSGAEAFKLLSSVKSFVVSGCAGDDPIAPQLVTSEGVKSTAPLLDILVETNPLDKKCDQRIRVSAQPLQVIFHAETIHRITDVFNPPQDVSLQQLQAAALNQLEVVKERSAAGLQAAIDNQSILDLGVTFAASHIIVPEHGAYKEGGSAIVVTLGSVVMSSVPRDKAAATAALESSPTQEQAVEIMRSASYDHFTIQLVDIQALVSLAGEDWQSYLCEGGKGSALHLLRPTTLKLDLYKCLLTNDPSLARFKIDICLPSICLSVADERLLQLAYIAQSIPQPPSSAPPVSSDIQSDEIQEAVVAEGDDLALARLEKTELNLQNSQERSSEDTPQFTNLILNFTINEMKVELDRKCESGYLPLLHTSVISSSVIVVNRTFNTDVDVVLGGILVQYIDGDGRENQLLSTPLTQGSDEALLKVNVTLVNPKSPDFEGKYMSTALLVSVAVSNLRAQLEQSAILRVLAFVEQVKAKLDEVAPQQEDLNIKTIKEQELGHAKSKPANLEKLKSKALMKQKKGDTTEITTLKLMAQLGQVNLVIGLHSRDVAQVAVGGLLVNVVVKGGDTMITSRLKDFSVIDPHPSALHPKIVEVVEAEAWEAKVGLYGGETEDDQYLDMSHVDTSIALTFGGARIVFLNKFVTDVLNWVDKFQAAKEALATASVAAAAAAQASLQEAYEKCYRISLSLTVRAPLILIPQDSGSLSGLMLDLGHITINNKFEMGQERNELGYPSLYDLINLDLENVKLARVEMSADGSVGVECDLLQPISLTISICRNLTIAWHKQRPEIDIAAKLRPIKMYVSEEDLLVALTVLQDNLGEQTDQSTTALESGPITAPGVAEREREVERELAEHGHVFTKIRFSFTIEAITLSLLTGGAHTAVLPSASSSTLTGDSKICQSPSKEPDSTTTALVRVPLEGGPAIPPSSSMNSTQDIAIIKTDGAPLATLSAVRKESLVTDQDHGEADEVDEAGDRQPLAEVSLDLVTLKGEVKSDATLVANLVLFDFVLQDSRTGREGHIRRMMERKVQLSKNGMLDLTFTKRPSGDIFVDVRMSSIVLVVHLPFLLRIQKFFTDNLPRPQHTPTPSAGKTPITKTKEPPKKIEREKSNDSGVGGGIMTVRIKVEQPDIILVEDLSNLDTQCIILHAEASCDVKMAPERQNITAGIKNFQLYTCSFSPEKRSQTMSQVLERCELEALYSVTSTHAEHIDVKVSQMNIRVSPGVIELLSSIAGTLGSEEGDKPQDEKIVGGIEVGQDWTGMWKPRTLNPAEFSFLEVEEAQEAVLDEGTGNIVRRSSAVTGSAKEVAFLDVQCILITLEAGSHTSPIPLIKLQSGFNSEISGFKSQKIHVEGLFKLEIAYFNPRLAVWEPLLEPVEQHETSPTTDHHIPWNVGFEMTYDTSFGEESRSPSAVTSPVTSPDADEVDFEAFPIMDPVMTLSFDASHPLEMTITKTFVDVACTLSEAFAEAYKRHDAAAKGPSAPYRVVNHTGLHISVAVQQSGFQVAGEGREKVEEVTVESGAEVELFEVRAITPKHRRVASLVAECQTAHDRTISIKLPALECSVMVPVARADKRYFEVEHRRIGEKWGLVASITVESGCKIVTLSSCVQVSNHLDVAVEVYYMTPRGNEVENVATLASDQSALLPLHAVYTPTAELFFCVEGHNVCIVPLVWRTLQNNPGQVHELQCPPKDLEEVHGTPFLIAAVSEVEQILWGDTSRRTVKSCLYSIHLRPRLVLHNLLPVPLSLEPPGTLSSCVLLPGTSLHLNKAQPGAMYLQLQLLNYISRDWVCGKPVETDPPELSVWTFESRGDVVGGPLYLDLGMLASQSQCTLALSLYCPFWMVNKTGLMLTYRGDTPNNIVVHEEGNTEAILFSFKSKSFFGKKKATVKVEDSEWSDKFSLDVVGNSGSILCKGHDRNYQLGVNIKLGNSGLTKLVVFTPFYQIMNNASYDLEVVEVGVPQAEWFTVLSGECIGWWPMTGERLVRVRVRGTQEPTPPMPYDRSLSILLPLHNKYGGITGEVSLSEGGTVMAFNEYCLANVTALLINHLSSTTISLWQEGTKHTKILLAPQTVMPYTWSDPAGKLNLIWAAGESKTTSHALDRDDQGVIEGTEMRWVVCLGNSQRCLVFTDVPNVVSSALNAVELERFQQDFIISLNSIGLSLVDDSTRREVTYISLASSGVVWENRKLKGKKQRPFTQAQTELLEKGYDLYQKQMKAITDPQAIQSQFPLSRNLEVDYATMTVKKPFHRKIRRTFQPGVWLELKVSEHQRQLHIKINSVQVDNQMCDVMFPVVLARVPPPKSVMAETVAKPFCELSVVQRMTSPVFTQYRYLALLVQEFHVKVELPFIFAILEVITPSSSLPQDSASMSLYSPKKYESDMEIVQGSLSASVTQLMAGGRRDYYHHLHLSPIKMHLSFSLTGTESGTSMPVGGQVIHLFLQSVGVTLSEVQDVVFRLAYFERQNNWLSQGQLLQEVIIHYRGQVIKQLYVLVLGLDVIGNPFGLVVGLTKGVEDLFYEPFQGAVEGPGEFAEGMLVGVGSFIGKTVGGAAGAVSRITGTIGKGVAALTLDEDYQKRRREAMNKKPADGIESLARGGKGIVTGVVDGVTGVFTKPIDGAREEGVEGFFKGVGKGVVGLVTRPASGVIDFASGSFDAVMRAADSTEDVLRRRPPRFIGIDSVVRPYVKHFAQGARMLRELEKGRYAKTDMYIAHAYIVGSRSVLMATSQRIMHFTPNDILGQLKIDWIHSYEELSEPPILTPKGLRLSVKQEKKRVLGVFGGGDNSKVVPLTSEEHAKHASQFARPQSTQSTQRGLFGVLGAIGSGITKRGKDVAEKISQDTSFSLSSLKSSPGSRTPQVVDKYSFHEVTVEDVKYIQVIPDDPYIQWFLSEVCKIFLK